MPIIRTIAQSTEIHYIASICQLTETPITISHYVHILIAKSLKKSYTILNRFSSFPQNVMQISRSAYNIIMILNKIYMF